MAQNQPIHNNAVVSEELEYMLRRIMCDKALLEHLDESKKKIFLERRRDIYQNLAGIMENTQRLSDGCSREQYILFCKEELLKAEIENLKEMYGTRQKKLYFMADIAIFSSILAVIFSLVGMYGSSLGIPFLHRLSESLLIYRLDEFIMFPFMIAGIISVAGVYLRNVLQEKAKRKITEVIEVCITPSESS